MMNFKDLNLLGEDKVKGYELREETRVVVATRK